MLCEDNLTEKELFDSMITMPKNKSPGNVDIKIELYQFFRHDIKDFYNFYKLLSNEKGVQCRTKTSYH